MVRLSRPAVSARRIPFMHVLVFVQLLCISTLILYIRSSIKSTASKSVETGDKAEKATIIQKESEPLKQNEPLVEKTTVNSLTTKRDRKDVDATVIGIATGYPLDVYQSFVGSLRKSGYQGNIILGVSPNIPPNVEQYLTARNVIMKKIHKTECNPLVTALEGCAAPYPDIKIRWARFPLARDWLLECKTCTGPVLITDVRDAYFQLNPFGDDAPVVDSLQVFEENPSQTTQHWLVEWPVRECKKVTFDKPMLCSGSTIGTRDDMIKYLERMYEEMKAWAADPKCHFQINGDDQSIHNYLFYAGHLPYARAIPPRQGIVHTVGVDGANIFEKSHMDKYVALGKSRGQARDIEYDGATENNWLGNHSTVTYKVINNEGFFITSDGRKVPLGYKWIVGTNSISYKLINDEGLFINADGSISRMIHQFDRFGPQLEDRWIRKQSFMQDSLE